MSSRICPSCNQKNNPSFNRCWKCGASFELPATASSEVPRAEKNDRGQIMVNIQTMGKILAANASRPSESFESLYHLEKSANAERMRFEYVLLQLWITQSALQHIYEADEKWKKIVDAMVAFVVKIVDNYQRGELLRIFCVGDIEEFYAKIFKKRWEVYTSAS